MDTTTANATGKLPPLTDKQLPLIYMAIVFGFVTIASIMRFYGWSYEAVTGTLGSRKRFGWLRSFPLRWGLTGFQPTLAAVREFGASPTLVRPFGGLQSTLPRLATLSDCSNRKVLPLAYKHIRIEDLKSEDYRLVPGDHFPVCYAHVDCGTNPIRLFHKINELHRRFRQDSDFAPLIQDGKFAVRVLTPSCGKAKGIADICSKRKTLGPVEIEVIKEIGECLG